LPELTLDPIAIGKGRAQPAGRIWQVSTYLIDVDWQAGSCSRRPT